MPRALTFFVTLFISIFAHAAATNCPIPRFELYRAAKLGAQSLAGGLWKCESLTARELAKTTCRNDLPELKQAISYRRDMSAFAVDQFFQGLAKNSHNQAQCRKDFFKLYERNSTKRATFNGKVKSAFDKIQKDLRPLVLLRNKKLTEYNLRVVESNQKTEGMTAFAKKRAAVLAKELKTLEMAIASKLTSVPLGYDPEVAQSLIQMSVNNKFDDATLRNGMQKAVGKYSETAKFFESKYIERSGDYCMGIDFKNMVGRSGQIDRWLETIPDGTREERAVKDKLACRLDAQYGVGQKRFSRAITLASFASYALPPAWLPKAGGTVAAMGAAQLALRGTSAVVSLLTMDAMRTQCFPANAFISADVQCNPEQEFNRVIEESQLTKCLGIVALTASLGGELAGVIRATQVK